MRCPGKALHEKDHANSQSEFFDQGHNLALAYFISVDDRKTGHISFTGSPRQRSMGTRDSTSALGGKLTSVGSALHLNHHGFPSHLRYKPAAWGHGPIGGNR